MKLEEQVLSIEQSKHLIELGLDMSDAALCWAIGEMSFQNTTLRHQSVVTMDSKPQRYAFIKEIIPTYTLQEVLDKLPNRIEENKGYYPYVDVFDEIVKYCSAITLSEEGTYLDTKDKSDSMLESAYNMLCWVLENGYLKKDK